MGKNSIVVCATVCAHFVCSCMNSANISVCSNTNNDCQTTGKTMAINFFSEKSFEDVKNQDKNIQKTQLQTSQRNNGLHNNSHDDSSNSSDSDSNSYSSSDTCRNSKETNSMSDENRSANPSDRDDAIIDDQENVFEKITFLHDYNTFLTVNNEMQSIIEDIVSQSAGLNLEDDEYDHGSPVEQFDELLKYYDEASLKSCPNFLKLYTLINDYCKKSQDLMEH